MTANQHTLVHVFAISSVSMTAYIGQHSAVKNKSQTIQQCNNQLKPSMHTSETYLDNSEAEVAFIEHNDFVFVRPVVEHVTVT